MYTSLRVVTPPVNPVVDLATMKSHCRVYFVDDDALLVSYTQTATQWAEKIINRCLITTGLKWMVSHSEQRSGTVADSWSYYGSVWPNFRNFHHNHMLELTRSPVQAVTAVTLGCPDGTSIVLDSTQYLTDLGPDPARLRIRHPMYGHDLRWIEVNYTAGYGDTAASVPAPIRHAVMLYTSFLYENRGSQGGDIPTAAEHLLAPYRVTYF